MRDPFIVVIPGFVIPSQNIRDRRHWAVSQRENDQCLMVIRSAMNRELPLAAHRDTKRRVHIMSLRRRLITDMANLIGGAKGLIDCLTRAGVIKDDADTWADISYAQTVGGRCTIITVSDWEKSP